MPFTGAADCSRAAVLTTSPATIASPSDGRAPNVTSTSPVLTATRTCRSCCSSRTQSRMARAARTARSGSPTESRPAETLRSTTGERAGVSCGRLAEGEGMPATVGYLVIDSTSPQQLLPFWCGLLGVQVDATIGEGQYVILSLPTGGLRI